MYKTVIGMFLGAILTSAVATAYAVTGTPPFNGFGLIDGTWLNGLAGGTNNNYQSGLSAGTGATSATSIQLSPGIRLFEVDTNGGSAVSLPLCVAGGDVTIYNGSTATLFVFPSLLINTLTATQDTLDGVNSAGGAINIPTTSSAEFYCAKNGKWGH